MSTRDFNVSYDIALHPAVATATAVSTVMIGRQSVAATMLRDCASIDIKKSISTMEVIGKLVVAAYDGSSGFQHCNGQILRSLRAYLRMVKDSRRLYSWFIKASLEAVENIRFAAALANYSQFDGAVNLLSETPSWRVSVWSRQEAYRGAVMMSVNWQKWLGLHPVAMLWSSGT
jgi:hypothetical protein